MLFLIKNKELQFKVEADDLSQFEGLYDEVLEGEENDHYDPFTNSLITVPPKPDDADDYVWYEGKWVSGTQTVVSTLNTLRPDFDAFMIGMRGTDMWNKIKYISTKSLRLNMAGTMLLAALTASKSTLGVKEAMEDLRSAMVESSQVGDFSNDEIDFINTRFKEHNISLVLDYSEVE